MIHLDTNFLIQSLVPGSAAEAKLQTWLKDGEDLGISSIGWSEFLCGPLSHEDEALAQELSPRPNRSLRLTHAKQQNYLTQLDGAHPALLTVRSLPWRYAATLV